MPLHHSHALPPNPNVVQGVWKGKPARFRRDRLIVSVKSNITSVDDAIDAVSAVAAEHLASTVGRFRPPKRRWAVLTFPPHQQARDRIPELAEKLAGRDDIEYAEPDFLGELHLTPGDTEFANQKPWTDAVGMEGAWDITQGANDVLMAVFDSGIPISAGQVDPDHPEMNGPRFIVRHEYGGVSVKHDYVKGTDVPADAYGHGSHTTGIIAAAANNGAGIAGINWVSPVYIARVVDEYGGIYSSYVKLAMDDLINYATEYGCMRVIVNMSFGFWQESDAIKQVCEDSNTGVFLLCVGPGSDITGNGLDFPGAYAAAYSHVIAVGSVDSGRIQLLYVSDYRTLTLFAPGINIISVAPDYLTTLWDPTKQYFDPYPLLSGTSQAAAIVSGIASLLWSANLA
ncbi:MAG TPA: S8 family serine peptidase, partial [Candidatus Krumholzibacteria bacterium]|nr:S8 family serine peptidase [Candidatus Krumholzibacteria bacterium]